MLLRLIQAEVDAQLEKRGYAEIKTPHIMDVELWHRSGHYDNYRENMYFSEVDDRQFALKPMNCPGACLVFGAERRSYRDLPLRLAEYGHVSRHEREGVLHGLLRVRAFTQDDAHVYCTLDQVRAEVDSICESIDELYSRFGFEDVRVELSTKPGEVDRLRRGLGGGREGADRSARGPGPRVRPQPRRRLVLRPQDRLPRDRRARPLLAARHLPARLPDAGALRAHLLGRGQLRAPARDDPPRSVGLAGALRRDPDRALRGPLPRLARARPGGRPSGRRPPQRAAAAIVAELASRGVRARSTIAPSPSGGRSATPSSRSCPTWSSWATARPNRARSRSARTRTGTWARCRPMRSPSDFRLDISRTALYFRVRWSSPTPRSAINDLTRRNSFI